MRSALRALFSPGASTNADSAAPAAVSPEQDTNARSQQGEDAAISSRQGASGSRARETDAKSEELLRQAAGHEEEQAAAMTANRLEAEPVSLEEYGTKKRWSWARKREARLAREAVVDAKREWKQHKAARKGRKTLQRRRAERHTVCRPLRRF
jgi:hypothetical protein